MARRHHPRTEPFPALRPFGVRGRTRLQDRQGHGDLPPGRAHPALDQLGQDLPDESAVLEGAPDGGAARGSQGQQARELLPATDRLLRLREDGHLDPWHHRPRCHRGLVVGRIPRRGRPAEGHSRQDLVLCPPPRQRDDASGEGGHHLRQLDPRQSRGHPGRLRRGAAAGHPGLRRRRCRREPVRDQGRDDLRARDRFGADRHHPRLGDPDRP